MIPIEVLQPRQDAVQTPAPAVYRVRIAAVAAAVSVVMTPWLVLILPGIWQRGPASSFGDVASTEVAVQNALRFRQALGPYDRFGWFHPGPALFYVLAGPYAAIGHNAIGLAVAACLLNMVSAAAIVALVGHRAGPKAGWAAAAAVLGFMLMIGVPDMRDAWSPMVITFPAALFVVLCVDTACGATWSAVVAVGIGVFLVQTEVGLLPVVIFALAATVVLRVARRGRAPAAAAARRNGVACALALLLAIAMWAPPLAQQIHGRPGNLSSIFQFFTNHQGHHRLSTAVNGLANGMLLSFGPHSLPAIPSPRPGYGTQFGVLLGLIALVCAVSAYRGQRAGVLLASAAAVLAAVYGFGLTRAEGDVGGYLVVWTRALTLCAALGASIALFAPRHAPAATGLPRARRAGPGDAWPPLFSPRGALTLSGFETSVVRRSPLRDYFATVGIAATAVRRLVPPDQRQVLVCIGSAAAWAHAAGVIADLRRDRRWDLPRPAAVVAHVRRRPDAFGARARGPPGGDPRTGPYVAIDTGRRHFRRRSRSRRLRRTRRCGAAPGLPRALARGRRAEAVPGCGIVEGEQRRILRPVPERRRGPQPVPASPSDPGRPGRPRRSVPTSATSPSSPTSTTARRRSSTPCSASRARSAITSRWSTGSWTPTTWSGRRASPSWPRTRRSGTAASRST